MSGPRPEVAEVFRSRRDDYLKQHWASAQQRRVLRDLCACRTAALGGHVKQCERCGHQEIAYNSCRNRHCPKCQAGRQADWMQARARDLLQVPYFHVVFTLPQPLGPIALHNRRVLYSILFKAASETLLTIAADPRHLGARIGFTALLHSWGQTLHFHPHLHCLVPGGGISQDENRWIASRRDFFLPVRVLSRFFRNRFLRHLRQAYRQGKLSFPGKLQPLSGPDRFNGLLNQLQSIPWVVYCKPPFAGPEPVLKYLARYTHRVAISNERLISIGPDKVSFRYKDYKRSRAQRTMTLEANEFIRRFLMHVLPKGFMRIRHYGFLANRHRRQKLALCRQLRGEPQPQIQPQTQSDTEGRADSPRPQVCPACREGTLRVVQTLHPGAHRIQPRMNSP